MLGLAQVSGFIDLIVLQNKLLLSTSNMSVKKQETITHRILQKSTGKKIGYARIFSQYEDVEVKDTKLINCDKISNNNEVVNILNDDLNLSSSEDEEVDYEDMIIESMKDLTSSSEDEESETSSDEDEGNA